MENPQVDCAPKRRQQRAPAIKFPAGIKREALGIGLRQVHYKELLETQVELDFLEIISENFMNDIPRCQSYLERLADKFPLVMHGVGLNLLGVDPLDDAYLDQLCRLAEKIHAPYVSDHLCWVGHKGVRHHDLLPIPYRKELIPFVAERIDKVQKRLGRPFALENLSSYVEFEDSDMTEWAFYREVISAGNCWAMLDLNNIFVSSVNHGFNPQTYLEHMDFTRVLQVHIAGHEKQPKGDIIDSHDRQVATPVWDLYRKAWNLGGPFPTLLEWDAKIPSLEIVVSELKKALHIREAKHSFEQTI